MNDGAGDRWECGVCWTVYDPAAGDEAAGVKVVAKSLVEPTRWIAENGGEAGYVITTKVAELPVGHGYNAKIGEYQNLIENGVIDPVKVTRSARSSGEPSGTSSASALALSAETARSRSLARMARTPYRLSKRL